MVACIPYLAIDTACLIEPAQMFAPKTTKIFYALIIESELQVVIMFIYWVSTCIEVHLGVFLVSCIVYDFIKLIFIIKFSSGAGGQILRQT